MKTAGLVLLAAFALGAPTLAWAWGDDCRVKAPREATVNAAGANRLRVEAKAGSLEITGEAGLDAVQARGTAWAKKPRFRPMTNAGLGPIVATSCSSQKSSKQVDESIRNVEEGLVAMELPSVAQQFQADHIRTPEKKSLSRRMAHYGVPGVSITVINDNRIEWSKGYGVMSTESKAPVTSETCFEAASTTKLLTSVVALHFVESGKLTLNNDVNDYLRSWKVPENEFTHEEEVTLQRILTHQSGLNRPDGGYSTEEGSAPTLVEVLKGEAPAKNKAAFVEYVPGSKHQYSNIGFNVVQLLLEDVLGRSYQEIVGETIFVPLGMTSSTFEFPLKPEVERKTIKPHGEMGEAHENWLHPTALAHGGLVTTPTDLALFAIELMQAYQGESDKILSQRMARSLFEVQCEIDPGQWFGMTGEGLGVFLMGEGESRYFLYAGFNAPGATSALVGSPSTGKGAVIMTNGAAGLQLSLEVLASIVNEYDWPTLP